jgi:microcompartment protein CcmK/EutM
VNDEGNGAREVLASPDGPVRPVVVAIVDAVEPTR